MKEKSLVKNAILSGGQKLLSIVFPLITFPYISRVLAINDIGKINFSTSIISYFVLIAGLGVNNYAAREGAKIRDNKIEFEKFSSEIFSLNIFSTLFAYCLLLLFFLLSEKLKSYKLLILINSFTIIGTTIGVNWIFSILEDYLYITIRTFFVQLMSLIAMFLLVKGNEDYIVYAMITVIANIGASIYNFIYARKFVKFKLTFKVNLKVHLKPILIIFASAVAVTIYVNSDLTILGWIGDDYSVGLYSRSTRIYTIIKQMVSSMVIVALPNFSYLLSKGMKEEYYQRANILFKNILLFIVPIGIGISVTAKDIIFIIAGKNYSEAVFSLQILGISSIFAVLSSFTTYCCLLPFKYEKVQMLATYLSAFCNICLNIIFIPFFLQNGAAGTTLFSEFLVFVIELGYLTKNNLKSVFIFRKNDIFTLILGGISIVIVSQLVQLFEMHFVIEFFTTVSFSILSYFFIIKYFKFSTYERLIYTLKDKF